MAKNECNKIRDKDDPYEVWKAESPSGPWVWRVLRKYQTPENEADNPNARWYCFVTSPFCPTGEYGDTYVRDIKGVAMQIDDGSLSPSNEEE